MRFTREHTYGAPRADGQRSCYPFCTPELKVRVPGTKTGMAAHDAAHDKYGVEGEFGDTFRDTF